MKLALEKCSAWELSVHPGWRDLWIAKVKEAAIGDGAEKFGMNTARSGQVQDLLEMVGVRSALAAMPPDLSPKHLATPDVLTVADAINELVRLRGEIVHTGAVPDDLRKGQVVEWRAFVENVADKLDSECRKQCKELL